MRVDLAKAEKGGKFHSFPCSSCVNRVRSRLELFLVKKHPFFVMCAMRDFRILYYEALSPVGFTGGASGKEPACQCRRCRRHGFNPWVRKKPWRRKWQPTPVFLPGESHGQRSLA